MTPADAASFGVSDGQCVNVRVLGSRSLILEEVPVRVSEQSALALHMDTDEANAAGAGKDCKCRIIGCCSGRACSDTPCQPQTKPQSTADACAVLPGKLITEHDVRELKGTGASCLAVSKGQLITPLAKDTAKAMGITLKFGG